MLNLKQDYKNLKRVKKILFVLSKYGLGYFFNLPAIGHYFKLDKKAFSKKIEKEKNGHLTLPQRVRMVFEDLGPTFVKLGQILSTRPDLISHEFIKEFSKLQDEVPPFSFLEVKEIFQKEFGKSINDVFIEFDEHPVASASLSQVHKAKLPDGKYVAVKIQRPNIEERVKSDISILFDLARFMDKKMINGHIYQPIEIVKEFSKNIKQELDFINEGHNINKFRVNFKNSETVYIPKVYWQLTTSKILTMEYIMGIKVSDIDSLHDSQYDKKLISARGADMILKQIFVDGFFHGDPHPGNIFIMENNIIALLDFGIVGRIEKSTMVNMASLLIATMENDADKVFKVLEQMEIIDLGVDVKELKIEIKDFMDKYYGVSLKQLEISVIVEEILEIMIRHQVEIPSDLMLLTKSLVTIEGVGRDLDPDFNMVAHAKPFVKQLISERYSLINLWNRSSESFKDFLNLLEVFPKDFVYLIKNLKKSGLNIGLQHKGLDKLINEINHSSNRLSFSMIIAALIIGSSMILGQSIGPFIFGYPAIGVIGYLFASFLGLFLVISILRSGRWK